MANSNLFLGKLKWLNGAVRIFLILTTIVSSFASLALDVNPVSADKVGICGTPGKDGVTTTLSIS